MKIKSHFYCTVKKSINMNFEQSKIILCFCVPNELVKKMQVTRNSKVGCLLNHFHKNNEDYNYIYEGNIVDSKSTFNDIKFNEGELIFALRKNNEDESLYQAAKTRSKIIKLSKDSQFSKKIRVLTNRNAQSEYNKVMDIRLMKAEGNFNLYRKKSHQSYLNELNDEEMTNDISITTEYEPLTEPCTEAMPILW